MNHRDSPTEREEERRRNQSTVDERAVTGSLVNDGKSRDAFQADEERKADTISRPGGFRNDPNVPTNPNEARERYLRKLRS